MQLLELAALRTGLLTSSGLSEKALNYLTEDDKTIAIKGLIEEFLEPAGEHFVDELVYRYLLTKGDALGGKALIGFMKHWLEYGELPEGEKMPKFKTVKFSFKDRQERDSTERLEFSADIHINVDGRFYLQLDDEIVERFRAVGLDAGVPNQRRKKHAGYFEASDLTNLMHQIDTLGNDYISKEIVEERMMIEYAVDTACSYYRDGDELLPNGEGAKRGDGSGWRDGTANPTFSTHPIVYGFQVYADPFLERTYRYRSGLTNRERSLRRFNSEMN